MAINLFAGLEVKGKLIKKDKAQVARELVTETPEISNLFNGLEVGGQIVGQPRQVEGTQGVVSEASTAQPIDRTPRFEIQPSPFPEAGQDTRATRELPELGQGGLLSSEPALSPGVGAAAFGGLTVSDPQEMASILQQQFPDLIGIQFDPAGNIIAANNETGARVVLNKPGLSQIDVMQGLGLMAAFTPAGRAVTAVPAALTGAAGLAARVGAGAAASGAIQAGVEAGQESLGGEFDRGEVALAAGLGGAAETVGPAIKAFQQARRGRALDVAGREVAETVEAIRPAREAVAGIEEATGSRVGLFQAQQTQQPSTLLKQRLLPQLDAGAKQAAKALEQQNKEAFDATAALINTIAPAEVVGTGAKRFRNAAKAAIAARKETRKIATGPLYKEALDEGASVDLTGPREIIEDLLADAPETGRFAASINKVKALIRPTTDIDGNSVEPSLRRLQKAKFDIDDMLEDFGENALGNSTKREVLQIKKLLVAQMEEASPLYKEANEEFARLSPAVGELEDSIIGSISKLDDVTLKNVTKRLFDATESNPEVVKQAKKIIQEVDPGAWDDIVRVEFQRRFAGIETLAEDIPGELAGNVPGQLRRAIFGNPEKRRVLLAALTPEQRKNFVYLDDVLKRASSGRQAGSPTAPFGQVLDRLRGSAGVIRDMIVRPLQSLQQFGERSLFDRNVGKMTDVLFNPKWEPKLKELRSVNPQSERARVIFSELMNAAKAAPQATRANDTRTEDNQ